MKTEDWFLDL